MKKVDTHAHIFDATQSVVADARYRPHYTASVERYIQNLDEHGFDYGVLIQPSFLGVDNTQMLAAIARYPDRLKGVAVVSEHSDLPTLRALQQQGIEGVRLNLFGKPVPDLTQAVWQAFLSHIAQLGWQLELHCPPAYLVQMMPALQHHQGAIVLDHFARPDPQLGLNDADYLTILDSLDPERYWVKVSGYYRLGPAEQGKDNARQALQMLLDKNMQHRLIWGSDWPHTQHEQEISYQATVAFMNELLGQSELRENILGKNACLLYSLES